MQIRLIEEFEELRQLSSSWNDLLWRSGSDCIFLTWEWIETWWETFGEDFTLTTLVAEADGHVKGIAPLMIGVRPGGRRALMIIGQGGETSAEYLDFINQPGSEEELTRRFVGYVTGPLRDKWDVLMLKRVLRSSPNWSSLVAGFNERGIDVYTRGPVKAPYVLLPQSMEELLATRSSNFRSQYRGSRRQLHAQGKVEILRAGQGISVEHAIDTVGKLHRQRFADRSTSFATARYLSFHHRISRVFAARDWLWLTLMTLNDEPIAGRYDFLYSGKMWCMQGGWSPEYSRFRPGMIMTGEAIAWGIAHGFREYDFLGGDRGYKDRWANGERMMSHLNVFNPGTLKGWLWPILRATKQKVQKLQRRNPIGERIGRSSRAPAD